MTSQADRDLRVANYYHLLKLRRSLDGQSRLGMLLLVLFVSICVFVGFQVLPFFYCYYEVKGLMEAQARKASMINDQDIRRNMMERIKKLEIPIDGEDDLKINRFSNKIAIELKYEEVLYIDLGEDRVYDLYVFEFNPRVEERVRAR